MSQRRAVLALAMTALAPYLLPIQFIPHPTLHPPPQLAKDELVHDGTAPPQAQ